MTLAIDKFLENLNESKLLSPARLSKAKEKFEETGKALETDSFSEFLISQNLLTGWQKSYLLQGKTKGFFIGAYKILRILGRGGNSYVYLAEHRRLKQQRAIKILARKRVKNQRDSSLKRFIQEARETAKLDHPNVIKCYDIGVEGKMYYLVMEYVQGRDLHSIVRDKGVLDFKLAASCVYQTATGLKYIKENGLIHRDMKPGNVFATAKGTIKILDLGLALLDRSENFDPSITIMHNDNIGTADYLAPEQALNSHQVDHRVDIYGLGCTLYYLLAGQPPFPEGTVVQRIAQHQSVMPQDLLELRPDCPKPLRDLCWSMIQKDPADRIQTYDEILDRIRLFSFGKDTAAGSPPQTNAPPQFVGDQFSHSQLDLGANNGGGFPGEFSGDPLDLGDISNYAIDEDPLSLPSETMPLGNHRSDTDPGRPKKIVRQGGPGVRKNQGSYWDGDEDDKESAAYQRFIARERLKTLWVFIGVAIGVAVAIATVVVMRTTEKVMEEKQLPPATQRES